ncbi:MAG: hypothetical protein AAGU14_00045 [Eubacteriaceae bacterium]
MDKRDINLTKYDISPKRYRELYYFCLQYEEMKEKLNSIYSLQSTRLDNNIQSSSTLDLTQKKALAAEKLSREVELIEQTAIAADNEIYQYLLMNVTNQVPYTFLRYDLGMPCGEKYFYKARRKFFYLLDMYK